MAMIASYENFHSSSNLNSNVSDSGVLIGITNLFCLKIRNTVQLEFLAVFDTHRYPTKFSGSYLLLKKFYLAGTHWYQITYLAGTRYLSVPKNCFSMGTRVPLMPTPDQKTSQKLPATWRSRCRCYRTCLSFNTRKSIGITHIPATI